MKFQMIMILKYIFSCFDLNRELENKSMITAKDLRKAPFQTKWIMNKENMKVTSYHGIPCVLWKKKNNIHLWSYNHKLYSIREKTIFDMDGTLCGWVNDDGVYGPAFGELPDIMCASLFYS